MQAIEQQPDTRVDATNDNRLAWYAFGVSALFASGRFPGAVPSILKDFFFTGFLGAFAGTLHTGKGIDWLIAWLIYPIIGLVFGGIKRIFSHTSIARWMFWTTITLAVLFLGESIILAIRHGTTVMYEFRR